MPALCVPPGRLPRLNRASRCRTERQGRGRHRWGLGHRAGARPPLRGGGHGARDGRHRAADARTRSRRRPRHAGCRRAARAVTNTSMESRRASPRQGRLRPVGGVHLCATTPVSAVVGSPSPSSPSGLRMGAGGEPVGVIHGMRAFLPHLPAQDDVPSSTLPRLWPVSPAAHGPVQRSKAAVVALSETFGSSWTTADHVGVSVLCPSWVRTATNISTSDRNRPERFAYALDTEQMTQMAAYKARRREQLATIALEADEVAAQVCDRGPRRTTFLRAHAPRERGGVRGAGPADRGRREPEEPPG